MTAHASAAAPSVPAITPAQHRAAGIALLAWLLLAVLCVAWELWLAPIRDGGSWLWLKALPLLLPLRGLMARDNKSFQWALLLVLLYAAEGAVRVFDPAPASMLAAVELALVLVFFVAAIVFLRPFKQSARAARAAQRSAHR